MASEQGDAAAVDYVLVSRRSRDRAGLRYQRRGIDDDANVANFVETETIMRVEVCFSGCIYLRHHSGRGESAGRIFKRIQSHTDPWIK